MKKVVCAIVGFGFCAQVLAVDISLTATNAGDAVSAKVRWAADPGQTYSVYTTPSLTNSWTNATPSGVLAPNPVGSHTIISTNRSGFFRLVKEDTDAPEVVELSPADDAIDVSSNAVIQITVGDETGIDTNSIMFSIAGWSNLTVNSPGVSYTNGIITFSPPDTLGSSGSVVTNTLSMQDTLGHSISNYMWTFRIERPPQVSSPFLSLTAPPQSQMMRMSSGETMMRSLPNVQPSAGSDEYHIVSVSSNSVLFSYTGTPPVMSNGTMLVSYDAANPFYRHVVSNDLDTIQQEITAYTTNIPLTQLLSEGSFSSGDFSSADPMQAYAMAADGTDLLTISFGDDLSGMELWDDPLIQLTEGSWSFVGAVDIAADIGWGRLESFDGKATGTLSIDISPEVIFYSGISGTNTVSLIQPVHKVFGGTIGVVPVWVEVIMELNAGVEYNADLAGNASTSVGITKEMSFEFSLRNGEWDRDRTSKPMVFDADPIVYDIDGHADAKVFIQPKLTVLALSLAGVWADMKPYAQFDMNFQTSPEEYSMALYYGMTATLGLDSRLKWGDLPSKTFDLIDPQPLWYTNYPPSAPVFGSPSKNIVVTQGEDVTLTAYATASPPPTYQWFYDNGGTMEPIGETSPVYEINNANPGHTGTYICKATSGGSSAFKTNILAVLSESLDEGLVAYYPFDGNAKDYSGNGNDGIVYGATLTSGVNGQAYSFDGLNDYIRLPMSSFSSQQLSVTGWWKVPTFTGNWGGSLLCGGITKASFDIHRSTSIKIDINYWDDRFIWLSNVQYPNQEWQFVSLTISNGVFNLFSDGEMGDSLNYEGILKRFGDDWTVGASFIGADEYISGDIDDIRIYNRALSASEVMQLYFEHRP